MNSMLKQDLAAALQPLPKELLHSFASIIDMASQHVGDINTGLAEGIYSRSENMDIGTKESLVALFQGACQEAMLQKTATAQSSIGSQNQAPSSGLPTIIVERDGGVIKCVRSSTPACVVILDEDTSGAEDEDVVEVNGDDVYVQNFQLTKYEGPGYDGVDPEFVLDVVSQVEDSEVESDSPGP